MSYLLTPKQKYLLKFNKKHVIDSQSDNVTVESADSMFSVESAKDSREKTIRTRVMVRLLKFDRDQHSGLNMVDKDLIYGVGKVKQKVSSSEESASSEEVDSQVNEAD